MSIERPDRTPIRRRIEQYTVSHGVPELVTREEAVRAGEIESDRRPIQSDRSANLTKSDYAIDAFHPDDMVLAP
jgi:hypothetical protein